MNRRITVCACLFAAFAPLLALALNQPGVGPGAGTRYATDAYPGFDSEDEMIKPSRKEPKLFGWITGPKRDDSAGQFAYCEELIAEESYAKAVKGLDALVREWPTSPEAPKAQLKLAELLLEKLDDLDAAFAELRYLVDFYSLQCDYDASVGRLYDIAGKMREEGKTVLFFRFRNTVDVRRAFECCVLRAPGAEWAPAAMFGAGSLVLFAEWYAMTVRGENRALPRGQGTHGRSARTRVQPLALPRHHIISRIGPLGGRKFRKGRSVRLAFGSAADARGRSVCISEILRFQNSYDKKRDQRL